MRSNVANVTNPTHANPVSDPLVRQVNGISAKTTRPRIGTNSTPIAEEKPRNGRTRELVREVIGDLQRSQKQTAIDAGCADSDFSAALNGKQRFDTDWLDAQDDTFVLTFVDKWLRARGLQRESKRAARMKLAATLFQTIVDLAEEDE
jgi:hypothetical protein